MFVIQFLMLLHEHQMVKNVVLVLNDMYEEAETIPSKPTLLALCSMSEKVTLIHSRMK